jgi:hypothetical protein
MNANEYALRERLERSQLQGVWPLCTTIFRLFRANDCLRNPRGWVTRLIFLLLKDIRPEGACKAPAVSCWSEKVERFKQIAYSRHGVDTNRLALVSDGPVKLLHVADEHTFSDSIYKVGEFDALNK